jgi:excisionase family DNA binding protein
MPGRSRKNGGDGMRHGEGLDIMPTPFPLTLSRSNGIVSPYQELPPTTAKDAKAPGRAPRAGSQPEGHTMVERRVGTAEILTIRDVAAYLKLPVSTVYRLAERRELPGHKVGRQWRFHKSILDDWFRQHAATVRVNVLVVDDEEITRQFMVSTLHSGQRQILTAASGEEALEIAKQADLDVVLLDLIMPGMGGVETFRQLHALRPELPVVIVTGYPDSDLMAKALEIGPFTMLNKPIDINQLQKVVDVIVGA